MPKPRATSKRALEEKIVATQETCPTTPAVEARSGLQCVIATAASLADRIHSLPRRFAASHGMSTTETSELAEEVAAVGREAVFDCGVLSSCVGKALEGAAEEARVRAAQLSAHAMLLEEAEGGEEEAEAGAAAAARALLSQSQEIALGCMAITCSNASLWHAVDAALHLRYDVDAALCAVRGEGLEAYLPGAWDNGISVAAVDGEGEVAESIEAGDVCVSVEGGCVTSVAVGEAGVVEVAYRVAEGSGGPLTVGMSVCGAVLPGSPWTVTRPLGDSVILASVAPERVAAFLRELSGWLPGRAYRLLYRGSRDCMTAAAFHGLCDGKGPTLVLVRCDEGWVFGGYAGVSWRSPPDGKAIRCEDAFLFSVTGPYTTAPVRFPINAAKANTALFYDAGYGPCFGGGLYVLAGSGSPTDCFDDMESKSILGLCYADSDTLGRVTAGLTGKHEFTPADVEVYAGVNRVARTSTL